MHNELSSSFLCLFGVFVCSLFFPFHWPMFGLSLWIAWLIVSISDQQTVLWYRFRVYFYCIIHSFRKDSTIDGHTLKSLFASTNASTNATAAAKHTLFRSINLMMCKIPTKEESKQQTNNHSALLFDRNQCRRKSKLGHFEIGCVWFYDFGMTCTHRQRTAPDEIECFDNFSPFAYRKSRLEHSRIKRERSGRDLVRAQITYCHIIMIKLAFDSVTYVGSIGENEFAGNK